MVKKSLLLSRLDSCPQPLLHGGAPALRHAQVPVQGRLLVPREEDPLSLHCLTEFAQIRVY